jgi:hypothetical protein
MKIRPGQAVFCDREELELPDAAAQVLDGVWCLAISISSSSSDPSASNKQNSAAFRYLLSIDLDT